MQTEMELAVWPSDFGLASLDVGCLQSMVAAKIAAAPVKFRYSTNPGESPSGTLPLLIHGDTKLTNFEDIAEHLRNLKQEVVLDGELTPNQRVEFFAYASYLRSRLYPALLHTLWVDNHNYNTVTHQWYTSKLYFPWNLFYLEKRRKFAQNYIKTVGKGESELLKEALQTLNLLSSKLGDNKYFCGDKPCSVDALIFGYLAPLLKLPLPSDRLYLHLSSLPNLSRFVESIICIYLPLPDELIRQQNIEKQTWEKRKSKAQRTAEENRLRKEQKKTETEQSNASSLRDTVLFGMGALTLSVLFAVHTGMISFIGEEDDKLEVQ
uniref:Metaxin n=1 Tax=Panagrolaimus sp. ES5 TaxID=591445 RepID=A0AC34FJL0_9BILA